MTSDELRAWLNDPVWSTKPRGVPPGLEAAVLALVADRDYLNDTNNGLLDLANERQNRIAVLEAKLAELEDCGEARTTEACGECRACLRVRGDAALLAKAAAESREKSLREALVKYGRHGGLCVYWQPGCHLKCDCGLAAALGAGKEGA